MSGAKDSSKRAVSSIHIACSNGLEIAYLLGGVNRQLICLCLITVGLKSAKYRYPPSPGRVCDDAIYPQRLVRRCILTVVPLSVSWIW